MVKDFLDIRNFTNKDIHLMFNNKNGLDFLNYLIKIYIIGIGNAKEEKDLWKKEGASLVINDIIKSYKLGEKEILDGK